MKNITTTITNKAISLHCRAKALLCSRKGDLATNTIGAIIIAVVVVGLLITAINAFFPNFFNSMFNSMSEKLNGNW